MSLLACAGFSVTNGTVMLTRAGAWYAMLTLDVGDDAQAPAVPAGPVTIATADGSFSYTGVTGAPDAPAGQWGGHFDLRVEGSVGGGIDTPLTSRFYSGATVRIILGDLARDAGEAIDSTVSSSILSASIPLWSRRAGTYGSCVGDVLRYACPTGTIWRTLANGNTWLGADAFTTVTLAQEFDLIDSKPAEMTCTIATETPAPELVPGVAFEWDIANSVTSNVSQVEHSISPSRCTTTLWFSNTLGDRVWSPIARTMAQVLAPTRFQGVFTGAVTGQASDGTLQIQLDDPTQLLTLSGQPRMPNLTGVPMRFTAPGVTLTVTAGARVDVIFEGGSPARPVVVGFDGSTNSITEWDITAPTMTIKCATALNLGGVTGAQGVMGGQDVKTYLDSKIEAAINALRTDMGTISPHKHLAGTLAAPPGGGAVTGSTGISSALSSIPTGMAPGDSPAISTNVFTGTP